MVYCSHLNCYQTVPCALHGAGERRDSITKFLDKVRGRAASVTESIKEAFSKKEDKVHVGGEDIVEVKTHSLEETVMHRPTIGQDALTTRTVSTEYGTAHTWEQQHEGGLGHRAKETVRGAAESVTETAVHVADIVGERASYVAEAIKETAATTQEKLAETGHNARVKLDDTLDRNFGGTAEKIHAEGHKVKQNALEDTARGAELVQEQLGIAAASLKDQEKTEGQKTDVEKLQQYHSSSDKPLDNALDRRFGNTADQVIVEGQKAKEGAIHETAHAAELLEEQVGKVASALRDQQNQEQQNL